jgi:predicted nucleic-acid-binding protein
LCEGEATLTISPLILAEVGYVLTKVYGREREQVVASLIELLQRQNICVYGMETNVAVEALELCRPSNRVSYADALLWAEARTAGATVRTFDARFPKQGVTVHAP